MSDQPKERLKNMKVLSVADKGSYFSKKQGKDVKTFTVKLQGVDDPSRTLEGEVGEPLPETVVADGVVEDVWVYEDTYGDRVTTKLFFPKPKGSGGGGKGGYKMSPEELLLKEKDLIYKIIGVGYSYALDICKETPGEITVEKFATVGNGIADAMMAKGKLVKG